MRIAAITARVSRVAASARLRFARVVVDVETHPHVAAALLLSEGVVLIGLALYLGLRG